MKYVAIFHANLNYAYLTEDQYAFVIREAYEMTFDTMRERLPGTKYVFEASGYTIEMMAKHRPESIEKLKQAIGRGECEFMGSPYAHPMLPNFPRKDMAWSLEFSHRAYEKHLGLRPVSFWNPECGWRSHVPELVREAGYRYLTGDFESYSRAMGVDGTPQRPEIHEKEATKEKNFYSFGFKYDLPGDDHALHYPFNRIHGLEEDQLRVFLRSDRICQYAVRYFMGMEGYSHDEYMETIRRYSGRTEGRSEGAVVIFADDAEYIGTNGWFRLKYQNEPDAVFEKVPDAQEKLIRLVEGVKELGEFITFAEACELEPNREVVTWDDDAAWHGAKASIWAETPMARLLRPWQDLVREKLNSIEASLGTEHREQAWYHLTNSYNSDGQWPPTLPQAPHIIHPFNYQYCFENLLKADLLVGGVDMEKLEPKAVETLQRILSMQQDLILNKAEQLQENGSAEEKRKAGLAKALIETSRDLESVERTGGRILYASDYTVRAEAMVEARRLVGGVVIEQASLKHGE
ncbi:MAG: hypothetical protein ACP5I4_08720 [Oceanipulchritudo sp.]